MNEQFNPADSKYQKMEDLPFEERKDFINDPKGGFVDKEAMHDYWEAQTMAKMADFIGMNITVNDILENRALGKEGDVDLEKNIALKAVEKDYRMLEYLPKDIKNMVRAIRVAKSLNE